MIGETASQIEQAGSQFNETASKMGETLKGTIKQTQDIAPVYVDTKQPNFFMTWGLKLIFN